MLIDPWLLKRQQKEIKIVTRLKPQVAEPQTNQHSSEPPMYHVFQDETGNRYAIPDTQDRQPPQTDQLFPIDQVNASRQVWSLTQFL